MKLLRDQLEQQSIDWRYLQYRFHRQALLSRSNHRVHESHQLSGVVSGLCCASFPFPAAHREDGVSQLPNLLSQLLQLASWQAEEVVQKL